MTPYLRSEIDRLIKRIKKALGIKRKYVHTMKYKEKKVWKDAMIYGTGFMKVEWIEPKKWYQIWRSK